MRHLLVLLSETAVKENGWQKFCNWVTSNGPGIAFIVFAVIALVIVFTFVARYMKKNYRRNYTKR